MIIYILIISIFSFIGLLELVHYLRPKSPLQVKYHDWDIKISTLNLNISGYLEIINPHKSMEVMIPELSIKPIPLGNQSLNELKIKTKIKAQHPDEESREDNYWQVYIVKSRKSTQAHVDITLETQSNQNIFNILESIWIEVSWLNYGPFGQINKINGFVIPIRKEQYHKNKWIELNNKVKILPIKTHILGVLDNPIDVLSEYVSHISKPGDILTIGESPLAIMQGRYVNPKNINISLMAKVLCSSFHPTSSLASACGMQSLIDLQGPSRIFIAWFFGAILKTFGIKGYFYKFAGQQARLIDDITGTTPPYDKNIVLGPIDCDNFCTESANKLGIDIAIVDVNDLGRIKILSSTKRCDKELLHQALISNPAGNANQHTPLVLVRPLTTIEDTNFQ